MGNLLRCQEGPTYRANHSRGLHPVQNGSFDSRLSPDPVCGELLRGGVVPRLIGEALAHFGHAMKGLPKEMQKTWLA